MGKKAAAVGDGGPNTIYKVRFSYGSAQPKPSQAGSQCDANADTYACRPRTGMYLSSHSYGKTLSSCLRALTTALRRTYDITRA